MRTKKAFLNTMIGLISTLVTTVLSFFLNRVFLTSLGLDYLGLNGIFSNALGMLSLAELGIGLAISYELYVPLAENNTKRIAALMNLYKRIYYIIAAVTFVIGVVVGVFICITAKTTEIPLFERIFYFIMFLGNNCCTYLLSYKRTLLEADQKSYVISTITSIISCIATILKVLVLFYFNSYFLYVLITIIQNIGINTIVSIYVDRNYSYIKNTSEKLDDDSYKKLVLEVKSRIVVKLSNVMVSSTDNIIIGSIISVASAGLFQNYSLILSQLNVFINQIVNSITPSLGNYVAIESKDKLRNIIKEIEFFNHIIGTFCFICFCTLITPFIQIWLGDYFLPFTVPVLLMCDFYITLIRDIHWKINNMTIGFKGNKRKYFHVLRAIINIFVSLIGAYRIGICGVVLGTVISSMVIWIAEVIYTYLIVFKVSPIKYFCRQGVYILQLVSIATLVMFIVRIIRIDNLFMYFILSGVLALVVTIISLLIINIKNPYLHKLIDRIRIILKRQNGGKI